jgi:hypothetical protein
MNNQEAAFLAESNRIEGYDYEARLYQETPCDKKHVNNSASAWRYMVLHHKEAITIEHILHLHQLQMHGSLSPANTGKLRSCRVYIGRHKPPEPELLDYYMEQFINDFNIKSSDPTTLHYEFEWIHPFVDGNGRVGRLLWAWDLLRRSKKIYPILDNYVQPARTALEAMINTEFHIRRNRYYQALNEFHFQRRESSSNLMSPLAVSCI